MENIWSICGRIIANQEDLEGYIEIEKRCSEIPSAGRAKDDPDIAKFDI